MKNECNIIRDILPLYAENMVSTDTIEFVEHHLKNCVECQKEYEKMKESEAPRVQTDIVPLIGLKRKMRAKKFQTIALTAILVLALIVSAFSFLSAPEFFPYSDDLISVTENEDESITVTFDRKVTDYSCIYYPNADVEIEPGEKVNGAYKIEAWTSVWSRLFSKRGVQSTTIQPEEGLITPVYYVSNDYEEDVCIYGQPLVKNGGTTTLPRLTLGYYLILMGICFFGLLIAWFVFKRKDNIRIWIERLILYPISYVIGHIAVLRFRTISYSIQRDFMLIIFLSIIIYCGMLLAHNIYRLRREIKETGTK